MLNDWSSLIDQIPMVSSIKEANSRKLSLAVIQPEDYPDFYLDRNAAKGAFQKAAGSKSFKYTPRLKFKLGGSNHNIKYLNQEVYEHLTPTSKHTFSKVKNRFKNNPKLLVGNMFAYRNNWLVIAGLG
jgi:hypothetical protein